MVSDKYIRQAQLLVQALPYVAQEDCFALKGGTAINLFVRNMPRLSVDIDLTYVQIEDRQTSLTNMDAALERILELLKQNLNAQVRRIAGGGQNDTRIQIQTGQTQIKIETSPVGRGTLFPPELRRMTDAAEDRLGFAEMPVVAFEELYAGKLVAALDRQHPRDLFDVKLLLENEGISDELWPMWRVPAARCTKFCGHRQSQFKKPTKINLQA